MVFPLGRRVPKGRWPTCPCHKSKSLALLNAAAAAGGADY
jgi:hypothetical protein